jgi:putative ABC transport system permease protein
MLLWTIFKVAVKSLLANKLRSCLAMLGIIIGVAAVISMVAMGAGAQKQMMDQMTAMGTNLLIIRPGQRGSGGVMTGTQQNLTLEDAEALAAEIPEIQAVAPVVGGNAQVKYLNKNSRVNVVGTSASYLPIRNYEVEKGRCFSEDEAAQLTHVAVLGPTTVQNLFENDAPLGQTIKLNGHNFTVIGVLKAKGDQGFFNPDDQIVIPYLTAMKKIFGLNRLREIDLQAFPNADVNKAQEAATTLLRKRHKTRDGAPDGFTVRNQAEMIETASNFNRTLSFLLGSIAGISLLVGGIGIMNIMLVTVTERTKEIGIRKALGAKNRHILGQFLIEAILMSGLGGFIGAGAGIGSSVLLNKFTDFSTVVGSWSIVMSWGFAAGVGVFFGFYPATRAAKMDPIEALRYE